MVASDEVDIAITYGPISDPRLVVHSFERGPLCALVAPSHALAKHERVSVAELLQHKLIFLPDVGLSAVCECAIWRSGAACHTGVSL